MSIRSKLRRQLRRELKRRLPARLLLSRQFRRCVGYPLNLHEPRTFNEKLQWLKLYYRAEVLHACADKYAVRAFVQRHVGEQVLNPLLGLWERPEEVDFDALPERFVIKATHGSAMNVVCRNKAELDVGKVRAMLDRWLRSDYYATSREWAYRGLKPRLMGEAFMGRTGQCPPDYKFFCFGGEPKVVQVDLDRFERHTRAMMDSAWEVLPFGLKYPPPASAPDRPANLTEMMEISRTLSRAVGAPFCRVDLYEVEGETRFGELTFYPVNGMGRFDPLIWDRRLGDWLQLSG